MCDGIDNDCNGVIDDGLPPLTYYPDADSDGFGDDSATSVDACEAPAGFTDAVGDCDDDAPNVFPGAPNRLHQTNLLYGSVFIYYDDDYGAVQDGGFGSCTHPVYGPPTSQDLSEIPAAQRRVGGTPAYEFSIPQGWTPFAFNFLTAADSAPSGYDFTAEIGFTMPWEPDGPGGLTHHIAEGAPTLMPCKNQGDCYKNQPSYHFHADGAYDGCWHYLNDVLGVTPQCEPLERVTGGLWSMYYDNSPERNEWGRGAFVDEISIPTGCADEYYDLMELAHSLDPTAPTSCEIVFPQVMLMDVNSVNIASPEWWEPYDQNQLGIMIDVKYKEATVYRGSVSKTTPIIPD